MSLLRVVPAVLLAVALMLTPGLAGAEVPADEHGEVDAEATHGDLEEAQATH